MLPGLAAIITASAVIPPSFEGTHASGNGSVFTFNGIALGDPSSDRRILVAVATASSTNNKPTLTINGTAATRLIEGGDSGSANVISASTAFFLLAVPAGATGDIVVSCNNASRCGIGVYALYGLLSETPLATGATASSPAAFSLTSASGALVFALANNGHDGVTTTWTGTPSPTEIYDELYPSSGSGYHSLAFVTASGATTDITATYSATVSAGRRHAVAVVLQ